MSRKHHSIVHSIPSVFLFILIGLFAISSLTLTLIGTRVYRSVTDTATGTIDSQIVLSYLCNKVRAYDSKGGIDLTIRDGLPVLCLYEEIDGKPYETAIYLYQGTMRELFMSRNGVFSPDNGEILVETADLAFRSVSDNLLEFTVTMPDGDTRTLRMALRAGIV